MCWFHSLCLNHFLLGNLTTAFLLCIPKGPRGPAASSINLIWEAFSCENDSPSSRATHLLIKDDLVHSPSILPKPAYWLLARSGHVTLDVPSGNFYEFWNHKKMFWTVPLGRGTSQGHRCDVKPELTEFIARPRKDHMNMKNTASRPVWRGCPCEACYRTGPRQPSPFTPMVCKRCWGTKANPAP